MITQVGQARLLVAALAILLLISTGLIVRARHEPGTGTGPLTTEVRNVSLGTAKTVRVDLNIGTGRLTVDGSARNLLDGRFTYNVPAWKPEISYAANGGQGMLSVMQPSTSVRDLHEPRYDWNLGLNSHVPIDLTVEIGAGSATLNLVGAQIRNLDLTTGAGNGTIVLDGRSLQRLQASTGAGALNVTLDGPWKHSLTGSLKSSAGAITLRTPPDAGVRITTNNVVGVINANGFTQLDGAWVNDLYGKTPVTLNLEVASTVGAINLEAAR